MAVVFPNFSTSGFFLRFPKNEREKCSVSCFLINNLFDLLSNVFGFIAVQEHTPTSPTPSFCIETQSFQKKQTNKSNNGWQSIFYISRNADAGSSAQSILFRQM
jgi:hypothetical protein